MEEGAEEGLGPEGFAAEDIPGHETLDPDTLEGLRGLFDDIASGEVADRQNARLREGLSPYSVFFDEPFDPAFVLEV